MHHARHWQNGLGLASQQTAERRAPNYDMIQVETITYLEAVCLLVVCDLNALQGVRAVALLAAKALLCAHHQTAARNPTANTA